MRECASGVSGACFDITSIIFLILWGGVRVIEKSIIGMQENAPLTPLTAA